MRKAHLNEAEVAKLYAAGATISELVKTFRSSIWQVSQAIRAQGVTIRKAGARAVPAEERFWSHVNKQGPLLKEALGRCWMWTGVFKRGGYGQFFPSSRRCVGAHAFSYELAYGPVLEGRVVAHKCDNPPCVRPTHFIRDCTPKQNSQDAVAKGRIAAQARHGMYRHDIATEDVIRLYQSGLSTRQVAKELGTSQLLVVQRLKHAGVKARPRSFHNRKPRPLGINQYSAKQPDPSLVEV
jgi:biotin operon repressor